MAQEKGKSAKKARKPIQHWKKYEKKGNSLERKSKFCPKCGAGYFLSTHKNRLYCGKCHYTEFLKNNQ